MESPSLEACVRLTAIGIIISLIPCLLGVQCAGGGTISGASTTRRSCSCPAACKRRSHACDSNDFWAELAATNVLVRA